MVTYEVQRPTSDERGIRVACPEHGHEEEFPVGRLSVAFYCPDCGFELEVTLHDDLDTRPWGEMC